jgi:tetratricopeptide (TPR) repeat protein
MISVALSGISLAQTTVDPLTGETTAAPEPAPVEAPRSADLTEANALVREQDYAGAESLLASLQAEYPGDFRVLFMRGEVLLALQKPAEALPILAEAAEIDGSKPRLQFQLGTAHQMSGETDEALSAFEREIENNEDPAIKVMSHLNRMVIFRERRKWPDAAKEMTAVLELQPTRSDDYGELATLFLRAGNTEKAAKALENGADHGFSSAQHHYDVAARYLESEQLDASIRQFRKAVALRPDMARAERDLGRALNRAGRLEEALSHLERYLELKPDARDRARVEGWIATLHGS